MKNRLNLTLPVRLAALGVLAVIVTAWVGLPHDASAQLAVPSFGASGAAPPAFRSALEGYQPYTDEKMLDWKQANDKVGQIGGWREYAKEASRADAPDAAPPGKPATAAGAATPPAPHHPESHKP